MGFTTKVYLTDGGDKQVVASGGTVDIEDGAALKVANVADIIINDVAIGTEGDTIAAGVPVAAITALSSTASGSEIATFAGAVISALEAFGIALEAE